MKRLYLIFTLAVLCSSCKKNLNGTYLVYKDLPELNALQMASPTEDTKSEVEQRIKSVFMGKKFSVEFQDDFISLSGNPYNNIILNKKVGNEQIEYYLGEKLYGTTLVQFRMMPNDTEYLVMASSCSRTQDKFKLQLKEANPFVLYIDNFAYQRVDGSTDLIGQFEELNHAVVDKLQGRTGICEVYLNSADPYYIGFLKLSKDRDWKVFNDRGGIRALLQQHLRYDDVKMQLDSPAIVDADSTLSDTSTVVDSLKK